MNVDKTDLFRFVIPGYVFLLVFVSFFVMAGRYVLLGKNIDLIILLAGIPIGYVLSFVYRRILYQWLISPSVGEEALQRHQNDVLRDYLGANYEGLLASFRLNNFRAEEAVSEYVNQRLFGTESIPMQAFRMTALHSLGGAVFSIIVALFILTSFHVSCLPYFVASSWGVLLFWMFIIWALMLAYGRMFHHSRLYWTIAIRRLRPEEWQNWMGRIPN